MGNLIFNGVSTKDLGLVIQAPPVYTFPSRDLSTQHVPGRNGDLIIDNKCYNNVNREYSIATAFRPGTNFIGNAEKIIHWLTSAKGYCRLEDSYDPLVFRKAEFHNDGSLTNYYDKATAITVTFDCKPQRYLKSGQEELSFDTSSVIISNPTNENALPVITISGITYSENDVVMLTVTNTDSSEVSASVTISDIGTKPVTIDSEEQCAYSKDENGIVEDLNRYINLNGLEFPDFKKGKNSILVEKYKESSLVIDKYNNIIKDNYKVLAAKYQPYDAIVESRQQKFDVKNFNNLKLSKEEVYDAKAYLNLCDEKADSYTFDSFNNVLSDYGQICSFSGQKSVFPEWLELVPSDDGKSFQLKLKASESYTAMTSNNYGAFIMTNNTNSITYYRAGDVIGEWKENAIGSVYLYQAEQDDASSAPYLKIGYSDVPDWVRAEFTYDGDYNTPGSYTPSKITYTGIKKGYYHTEKTGLFGKSKWNYSQEDSTIKLGEVAWSTWKKAYISTSGLSVSTNTQFAFKYLEKEAQYDDVITTKTDSDGNEVTKIVNKVHFKVRDVSKNLDLTSVVFDVVDPGYYRINNDELSEFSYYGKSAQLSRINNDTTKSNVIYYLEEIPNYSSEKDYPEWLSSDLILTSSSEDPQTKINPKSVDFSVTQDAWYRYSYKINDKINYTEWIQKKSGEQIGILTPDTRTIVHEPTEAYTIYMLKEKPQVFTYTDAEGNKIDNIGFYDKDDVVYSDNIPPEWVKVSRQKGIKEDGSDDKIQFEVVKSGYYKWDTNVDWIKLEVGKNIVESNLNDDTTIYYMESLPLYKDLDEVFMRVSESPTGNPENVKIYAKIEGYFKVGSSMDWSYHYVNDEISEIKTTEDITIKYLVKSEEVMEGLSIKITPRWWML